MGIFQQQPDKRSGDGLALTEWNDLSNAIAGNAGFTLALAKDDKIAIGTRVADAKLTVTGNVHINDVNATGYSSPLSISGDGKENYPDGAMHITSDCILFGGNNEGRQIDSGQISAGKHLPNSLNIVGMSSKEEPGARKVNVWAEGGMVVKGDLTSSGKISSGQFSGDGSGLTNLSVPALEAKIKSLENTVKELQLKLNSNPLVDTKTSGQQPPVKAAPYKLDSYKTSFSSR